MEDLQKDLVKTYRRLKKILKKYEKPLIPKIDLDSKYDLWSIKNIEIDGRKKKEVYFAGLIIQSNYVGFYYMPIYTDTDLAEVFKPELLSLLKGKSCFHIKELTPEIREQVEEALEVGYKRYKENGWV